MFVNMYWFIFGHPACIATTNNVMMSDNCHQINNCCPFVDHYSLIIILHSFQIFCLHFHFFWMYNTMQHERSDGVEFFVCVCFKACNHMILHESACYPHNYLHYITFINLTLPTILMKVYFYHEVLSSALWCLFIWQYLIFVYIQ